MSGVCDQSTTVCGRARYTALVERGPGQRGAEIQTAAALLAQRGGERQQTQAVRLLLGTGQQHPAGGQ